MIQAHLTAQYLDALALTDPAVRRWMDRQLITTFDEFLEFLYDDLHLAIERLELNPQNFSEESEDATTQRLLDIAFGLGYAGEHSQAGGNVDIVISNNRLGFSWIGEAKKFGDVGDLREGYLQLSTRYRASRDAAGVMHGGLIGYLRRPNAAKCMQDWEAHFATMPAATGSTRTACPRRGELGFVSEHNHQDFGTPLRVWHTCVVLEFSPKDRSARAAKRYAP